MKSINKEKFLELIDSGLQFYEFVIPDLKQVDDQKCENTYNPFYDDRNPSLSVYYNEVKEQWFFKDHGHSPNREEYFGDVFEFAKKYYTEKGLTLSFTDLVMEMAKDLNINSSNFMNNQNTSFDYRNSWNQRSNTEHDAWDLGYDLLLKEDDDCIKDAVSYFSQYGITEQIVKRYNVRSIKKYLFVDKQAKLSKRVYDHTVIAYMKAGYVKFYSPDPKRFWFVGAKPKEYVFGYDEIIKRIQKTKIYPDGMLIITGGEKDVLTLAALGYDAVCFNSETAIPPTEVCDNLFSWYKKVLVMYDNDETGIQCSEKLVQKYQHKINIKLFRWSSTLMESWGKDVSDYVKLGFNIEELNKEIERSFLVEKDSSVVKESSNTLQTFGIDEAKYRSECLHESIYERIPLILKKATSLFADRIEKDIVLLSLLGVCSSLFPKVKGMYDGRRTGTNLYIFISAPASAGKGVMIWARDAGSKVQSYLKKAYVSEMASYNQAIAEAAEGGGRKDEIERPKIKLLFIPANSSTSKLFELLDANQNFGVLFQTEADTLTNTLKNEWGDFSELLRAAFHNEPVSLARRTNNELLDIEAPHLSVVLSGTPDQVNKLINNVENGFFSRFLFYDFTAPVVWKDQFRDQDDEVEKAFKGIAEKLLQYWKRQNVINERIFYIDDQSRKDVNSFFSNRLLEMYGEHGEAIVANVKRACLMCYRIAMIISALRLFESTEELPQKVMIEKQDVDIALIIVENQLGHLERVFKRLESTSNTSKLNTQQRMLFNQLKDEFTKGEYDILAASFSIKNKTAERYLSIYVKQGLIERPQHGKYLKL